MKTIRGYLAKDNERSREGRKRETLTGSFSSVLLGPNLVPDLPEQKYAVIHALHAGKEKNHSERCGSDSSLIPDFSIPSLSLKPHASRWRNEAQ